MSLILLLRGFGVAFGENTVLRSIDLDVPATGVTSLMGPGGAGKSTLVRTLAGHNDAQPLLRTWGIARWEGRPLEGNARPFLLAQSARLMISSVVENVAIGFARREVMTTQEQRRRVVSLLHELRLSTLADRLDARVLELSLAEQRAVAVARAVAGEHPLVLLDEPTVGLDDDTRVPLLDLVREESRRRAFFFVTHNRRDPLVLGGSVALLVNGRIAEQAPVEQFFSEPRTSVGRHFVQTGTCYVDPDEEPAPESEAVETPRFTRPAPGTARPPSSARMSSPRVPRGLHWVRRGALAGLPRPGLLVDVAEDLAGLWGLGIDTLVSLEETRTVPDELLLQHGLTSIWLPIRDMQAPSVDEAFELCRRIHARIAGGGSVAVHCRAGLGRTGTILAAFLVWEGQCALDALESVRCVQPRFVQSDEQVEFLSVFASHCRAVERMSVTNA